MNASQQFFPEGSHLANAITKCFARLILATYSSAQTLIFNLTGFNELCFISEASLAKR
jgi:hypothetical protein